MPATRASRATPAPKKRGRSPAAVPSTPAAPIATVSPFSPRDIELLKALKDKALSKGVDIDAPAASPANIVSDLCKEFDENKYEAKDNAAFDRLTDAIGALQPAAQPGVSIAIEAVLDKLVNTLAGALSKNTDAAPNKLAAQKAEKERQKLGMLFHRDLLEAIVLLHGAARASDLEGDYLPAAHFIATKIAGDQLTNVITDISATTAACRWNKADYEQFALRALTVVHGGLWMKDIVKRRDNFKIEKQVFTMASKEYVQSIKDTAAPFEWAFSAVGRGQAAAPTMLAQWLEDIQQRTVNGFVNPFLANTVIHTIGKEDEWGKTATWDVILSNAKSADNWVINRAPPAPAAYSNVAEPPAPTNAVGIQPHNAAGTPTQVGTQQQDRDCILAAVLDIKESFEMGRRENIESSRRREDLDKRTTQHIQELSKDSYAARGDMRDLRKDSYASRDDMQRMREDTADMRRDNKRVSNQEPASPKDNDQRAHWGKCFFCGKTGHSARECKGTCHECGGANRYSHKRDCSNVPKASPKGGKGGKNASSPYGRGRGRGNRDSRDGYDRRSTEDGSAQQESKTEHESKEAPKNGQGRS